jgi:hypothetical protein
VAARIHFPFFFSHLLNKKARSAKNIAAKGDMKIRVSLKTSIDKLDTNNKTDATTKTAPMRMIRVEMGVLTSPFNSNPRNSLRGITIPIITAVAIPKANVPIPTRIGKRPMFIDT